MGQHPLLRRALSDRSLTLLFIGLKYPIIQSALTCAIAAGRPAHVRPARKGAPATCARGLSHPPAPGQHVPTITSTRYPGRRETRTAGRTSGFICRLRARTRYYLIILCSTYTTLKKASKVLKKCNSATIQLLIAGFYLNHISLYAYKPTNHVYYATPDRTTHQVIHGKFTLV